MDILGIGNALIDVFWFSEDESALSLGLHPNRAAHVSAERLDELMLAVDEPIFVAGGSAANSVKIASALGAETAFVGCVGTEESEPDAGAKAFVAELTSFGVDVRAEGRKGTTGRCLVIRMPGGLKSVACAPGAATAITIDQISGELVSNARVALVDGPILANEALFSRVAALCRELDVPVALDGGSAEIVRRHRDAIESLLSTNKAILLFNADEANAFASGYSDAHDASDARDASREPTRGMTQASSPDADDRLADEVFSRIASGDGAYPCIVRKRGERGAEAWCASRRAEDAPARAEAALDDTGAGDAFNGAFLAAWLRKLPLADALAFANETARCALCVPGSNLDRDRLRELKAKLDGICRAAPSGERVRRP